MTLFAILLRLKVITCMLMFSSIKDCIYRHYVIFYYSFKIYVTYFVTNFMIFKKSYFKIRCLGDI